jgi:hypothetical protein
MSEPYATVERDGNRTTYTLHYREGTTPMTIVFQGHVKTVELGAPGLLDVHIQTPQAECGQVVVLHVPATQGAHWLPGRTVNFTVHAYDPSAPQPA